MGKGYHIEVKARRGETTEKLIRRFSKKVREERIIEEARERMYYIKPSVKRRREKIRRKKVLEKLEEVLDNITIYNYQNRISQFNFLQFYVSMDRSIKISCYL